MLISHPISGRVDRVFATETVGSGSISGRSKPKTIKLGIHSFPAWCSALNGQCECEASTCVVDSWQLDSENERSPSLNPGRGNFNKM